MRICVLQSSYEGSDSALQDVDDKPAQPGLFTTQHAFEYRFIHKATAKEEIDALAAEGFDFYFNFMWGTLDDPVAGVLESRYFESLNLPSCGIRSWERLMTKNDFYKNARRRGAPPVPGIDGFPLFVKPANGCASQLIDDQSVCHNQEELKGALRRINTSLYEARVRRAEAMGIEDTKAYAESYNPVGRDSDDVVVQEYIDGEDYTCTVLQMCDACIALTPFKVVTKETPRTEKFLTFELKFDDETRIELLRKKENPVLFERLQKVAIEAFTVSGCQGSNMGCDVDLRAQPNGDVFAIEVNPQPAAFMPEGPFQDLPIIHSLPGGHPAVINIFIANHLLRNAAQQDVSEKIATTYDGLASKYDTLLGESSEIAAGIRNLTQAYDFDGTVFDLACGTGVFGRMLAESNAARGSRLLGFDISAQMGDVCWSTGLYEAVHIESMEQALLNCDRFAERVDHIVCFSAIHFLRPEIFAFVLVLSFTLAKKSITISVDEIPEVYNAKLEQMNVGHMHSWNHLAYMLAFGEPPNWRLKRSTRQYSWTSPATGDEISTTYFRFERVGETQDLMFKGPELPN
jgi:SAM-dependent methyltransferase